jgi:hypothetical protein
LFPQFVHDVKEARESGLLVGEAVHGGKGKPLPYLANMLRVAFLAGLCALSFKASGQTEFQLLSGFVLPHRPEMARLVTGHATGFSLSHWTEQYEGWAAHHGRWGIRQGAMLSLLDAGSPELGVQASALWLTRFPVRELSFLELGLGPTWSSRSYRTDGASSFALASPWNLGLQVGMARRIRAPGPIHFTVGAALTHLSNGGLHQPNLGTNALTARVGLHWGSPPMRYPEVIVPPATCIRVNRWHAGLRVGARDAGLPGGPLHPISTFRFLWERRAEALNAGPMLRRFAWSPVVAAQLTLNQSRRPESPGNASARWQPAVLVGARWWVGNVGLQFAHGQILANASPDLGPSHLDAALVWRMRTHWMVELGLRAFSMRAEHPALGVTWTPVTDNPSRRTTGR